MRTTTRGRQPVTAAPTGKPRRTGRPPARADFGAPIDGFFDRQPAQLRAILDELRRLVEEVAPDATASLKWGMPFYAVNGTMMLAGEGKSGRHLKLVSLADLPRAAVRGWLRVAAALARGGGS